MFKSLLQENSLMNGIISMNNEDLLKKYPYFINPAVEEYREATGERKTMLARRIATAIGDIPTLRTILGIDPEEFATFYPDTRGTKPSTSDTIDSFIDRFADPKIPQPSEVEELIAPVATYNIEDLDNEEEEIFDDPENETLSILDSFLTKNPPKKPMAKKQKTQKREPEPIASQPGNLSESLAKVMIKNGNYQKAIEIITDICLKNPKKSIYFADQIRFLKKLMANAGNK